MLKPLDSQDGRYRRWRFRDDDRGSFNRIWMDERCGAERRTPIAEPEDCSKQRELRGSRDLKKIGA